MAQHEKKCISKYLGKGVTLTSKNVFRENLNFSERFLQKLSAVILGGSNFSFSERKKYPSLWNKVKKITPLFKKITQRNIPTLGICFGHQYIAYILGAEVIRDKSQQEIGAFKVFLTSKGQEDPLFQGVPSDFFIQEAHKDSIKKLPAQAILLTKGDRCGIQSFRYKNMYGVQFHPELNNKDMLIRARFNPDYIIEKSANSKLTLSGKRIIKNFLKLSQKIK